MQVSAELTRLYRIRNTQIDTSPLFSEPVRARVHIDG